MIPDSPAVKYFPEYKYRCGVVWILFLTKTQSCKYVDWNTQGDKEQVTQIRGLQEVCL